jgi:hypothetical protein
MAVMNFAGSLRLGRLLLGTTLCCPPGGAIYSQSASSNPATAPAAPGVILVDIAGNGMRNDHYWQYEVRPSSGLVWLVKDEQFKPRSQTDVPHIFQEPAGAIQGCEHKPSAPAPDGRFTAQCTGSSFHDEEISIVEIGSARKLSRWTRKDRSISGFAWAPDGLSVAILSESEHYGKDPLGIVAGVSGHPIPHSSVFLDVIDIRTGRVSEYLIRANVLYARSRILKW